jgi:hypothetical protein
MTSNLTTIPERPRAAALSIALLTLAASITSIGNQFAYDDVALVATNDRVHSMHAWWMRFAEPYWPETFAHSLYRPITMLGFTLQWTLGGGTPFVFHLTSIVLYAACAVGVLLLARELLSPAAAWFAAAIFAVHPVHVEAVGNVIGQSELLAGGSLVFGTWWYVRARKAGAIGLRDAVILAAIYAGGVLSKESAIVLPGLVIAAELTVLRKPRATTESLARSWLLTAAALVIVVVGSLCLRRAAIGAWLGDYPVPALASLTASERGLTMLAASREWLRLLVWPATLSLSYSPPYLPTVEAFDPWVLLGVGLVTAVIVVILAMHRRAPSVAFGLLWFAIAILPVSNLFFVSGVFIAERTLFAPSVGFVLAIGGFSQFIWPRLPSREIGRGLVAALAVVLIAGVVRSAGRQRDWFDTAHITTAAVRDLPDAYTVDALYGEYLATRGAAGTAEKWLRRSIALYSKDPEPLVELANLYVNARLWTAADSTFRKALVIDPKLSSARAGLVLCLLQMKNFSDARAQAEIGVASGESVDTFRRLVSAIDSASKKP